MSVYVWHCGLTCKLLCLIPDKNVEGVLVEPVRKCTFALTTSRNSKVGYNTSRMGSSSADDLTLVFSTEDWQSLEVVLSQNMQTLAAYLQRWRLKFSMARTAFHKREANRKLQIQICGTHMPSFTKTNYLCVTLERSFTF